ncbi:MAG: hypothetical protein COB25_000270 [Oceanospirillales bacterium]|nr:hypothetical protein [Oceanospirillales bacterium]
MNQADRFTLPLQTAAYSGVMFARTDVKSLVVDVGQSIVGIQNARRGRYIAYYGDKRRRALERLEDADEVITYNGNGYDISELDKLSAELRGTQFCMTGMHTDMRELCWPGILGANLTSTYREHIGVEREFSDTYEGSNQSDVFMTKMLWLHWKKHGKFRA